MWVIGWQRDGDLRPTVFWSLAFVVQPSQISHVVSRHYFFMLLASVNSFLRVRLVFTAPLLQNSKHQGTNLHCHRSNPILLGTICLHNLKWTIVSVCMQESWEKMTTYFWNSWFNAWASRDIGFLLQSHSLVIRLICGSKISQPYFRFLNYIHIYLLVCRRCCCTQ
jgi:hypothetical protein